MSMDFFLLFTLTGMHVRTFVVYARRYIGIFYLYMLKSLYLPDYVDHDRMDLCPGNPFLILFVMNLCNITFLMSRW